MSGEAEPRWRGEWIDAGDGRGDGGFERILFRRVVELASVPAQVIVRIAADARYVMWVNGTEIGRGPVRSQPNRLTHDRHDLAPHLRRGRNVVVVLVTRYGAPNAVWQPAAVESGLGTRASMVLDAPWCEIPLETGPEWQSMRTAAWTDSPPRNKLEALPIEILDARRLPTDWAEGTDAGEWMPCGSARAGHSGGGQRSRPPVYPFGALPAADLPPTEVKTVSLQVVEAAEIPAVPAASPVDDVFTALAAAEHADTTAEATSEVTRLPAGSQYSLDGDARCILLVFDAGRVVSGVVSFDVDAPTGTRFRMAYLERPFNPEDHTRYRPRAGAQVVVRGGRSTYRGMEVSGLRLIAMVVDTPRGGTVRIDGVRVDERVGPMRGDANFVSSDPDLERLWRAGVRTVQLNSTDAFSDCPTREQRAWVGDATVHIGVHLAVNADLRLVERHLELTDSPRPDGILPMAVAGDLEASGGVTIPDWSLHWIHAVHQYALVSKNRDVVAARIPTALRIVRWFLPYLREGVLTDVPEWVLIDWSSVSTEGQSSVLTALWARALREVADLCSWLGDRGSAAWALGLIASVERGFDVFWDERRGLYIDHIVGGSPQLAASQAASASAIVAGLVPAYRMARVVARMTDETSLVDRGWNFPSPRVDLAQKLRDRRDGVKRVDWDAEHEVVRAEPFFSYVVHDAVAAAGRADLLPGLLLRWRRFLVDGYDTFGECWHWGTPAHGWSSTPTKDIVRHILGVRPLDLESDTYVVSPAETGGTALSGRVPTHRGTLAVAVDGDRIAIDTPVPVILSTRAGPRSLPPGSHVIDKVPLRR